MDGVMIAGTSSGVGKTVACLAIMAGLEEEGTTVQPAKAGPDFIDPSHHEVIAGRPSRTLDTWLQGQPGLRRNYHRGDGDFCVVEGVMGLYDGECASTAQIAADLQLPVILVVDGGGGMESVAATALGFQQYAHQIPVDIEVLGVIAQRTHGGRHAQGVREALPGSLEWFGHIPPQDELSIPERHLGLHMGEEAPLDHETLCECAASIDLDRLQSAGREPPEPPAEQGTRQQDVRIAVARDPAFRFIYPATVERLQERASVVTFAPTTDEPLPPCDGVYLPGGYPELHAETLGSSPSLKTIGDRATEGLPVFGECGGFIALAESLQTVEGDRYQMAGVLPAEVEMHDRYQALDHVAYEAITSTVVGPEGTAYHGHEFHYSSATLGEDARLALEMERGAGIRDGYDGLVEYETLGTYSHVHPASGAFDAFIESVTHD